MKTNIFWGDLTDVSATKEALFNVHQNCLKEEFVRSSASVSAGISVRSARKLYISWIKESEKYLI